MGESIGEVDAIIRTAQNNMEGTLNLIRLYRVCEDCHKEAEGIERDRFLDGRDRKAGGQLAKEASTAGRQSLESAVLLVRQARIAIERIKELVLALVSEESEAQKIDK
jgi:hypothetical protein